MNAASMARGVMAAVLVGTTSSAALAQAQTPSNAHGFFQAVTQNQAVLFVDLARQPADAPRRVASLESSGCLSRIAFTEGAPGASLYTVDWREVRSSRNDGQQGLRLSGPTLDYLLIFENAEMASRMGNALAIVRRSCDPTQGFGF